jgi:DNA (cytosine-5)-methyltransferase 1
MNFIEVCAGCGGLGAGLMNAGFTPILLNEIDKMCCETLKKNHPSVHIEQKCMTTLDLSQFRNKIDILAGGVPCQAFSQAGKREGLGDPRGQLIVDFNRLVNECQPKIILVENVKGLVTHDKGRTFSQIIELFENNGAYKIFHKILNARDYDVPQKRERVIIIGVRKDIARDFEYPKPAGKSVVLRDVLTDVPPSPGVKYSQDKAAIMRLVPPGGCWVDLPEDIQREYMGASFESGGGKRGIARRLSMNEPSLTLTTSPNQKQTERCHPVETRPFTVREYARIQTFPDHYTFVGGVAAQYKQIGNAVPVKLAEAIGREIHKFLSTT